MTDIQLSAVQALIDILAWCAPIAVTFTIGVTLIRFFLKFLRGERL